ncbi:MAG: hypothetical protein ABGY11_01075 [Candidatus Thioglobus sp.]|jgi:hypothetical protein
MKLIGSIKKPRWYNIKCCCGTEVMDKHPIKMCLHCKFEQAEKSLPDKDFKVNRDIVNEKTGKIIKKQTKIIKEVTIVRGSVYEDVIGWTWN